MNYLHLKKPAPGVCPDRHHSGEGFAVSTRGSDIQKNRKCVQNWSKILLGRKSNFAQLSPVLAQHFNASSREDFHGMARSDNSPPHYIVPHATIDEEADHSGNQITLFLSLSVTLLSLPWLTSNPAGFLIPAALLVLPLPGAALRPAVGEGLMLLYGGIRWLLLNKSTIQLETEGKLPTHAAPQHSIYPVSGMHGRGGYNRDVSNVHNAAPTRRRLANHLYSQKYVDTRMPTHTSAIETPRYLPHNMSSSRSAPRGTTWVSTDSDWVPFDTSRGPSSLYSRQIHPQATSHIYDNHSPVEMDVHGGMVQPRIVNFDDKIWTQLRDMERPMQQPHSLYQDSHSKPDAIELERGFYGHLLNADLAVPPHAWQSNVEDQQQQQHLHSAPLSGGTSSYSEKRYISNVVPASSLLTSPESSLMVTGLLKVAPWMKSWGGFQ